MPAEVGGRVNPFALLADSVNCVFCHAVDLRRPLAEIEAFQPQRKTMTRKMRGLERIASTCLVMAETEEQRAGMLRTFLDQKQRRFEETRVPGFDTVPAKKAFFALGTEAFAKAGMLKFFGLRVGDEIVATLWGLVDGTCYYGLMLSFAGGAWEKHSVGRISYLWTQQWLHRHGFEVLDLGIGDETWKLEHCDITVPLSRKQMVMTLRGRFYVARRGLLQRLRAMSIWQRLRPYKWIVLRALQRRMSGASGNSAG
jgi:CelD/BcsL family acetyltransferase involved in cellulose biosynthesis